MIVHLFHTDSARQRLFVGPLAPHIEALADELISQGYTTKSTEMKLRLIAELSRSLDRRRLPVTALDERLINRFLDSHRRRRFGRGSKATGRMLLKFLRACGEIPYPAKVVDHSPVPHLLCEYERYLLSERGLSPATLTNYVPVARQFLTERFGADSLELDALSLQGVHPFILRHARKVSRSRAQLIVTALRSFFRFLYQRGDIRNDLAGALPSVAKLADTPAQITSAFAGRARNYKLRSANTD